VRDGVAMAEIRDDVRGESEDEEEASCEETCLVRARERTKKK